MKSVIFWVSLFSSLVAAQEETDFLSKGAAVTIEGVKLRQSNSEDSSWTIVAEFGMPEGEKGEHYKFAITEEGKIPVSRRKMFLDLSTINPIPRPAPKPSSFIQLPNFVSTEGTLGREFFEKHGGIIHFGRLKAYLGNARPPTPTALESIDGRIINGRLVGKVPEKNELKFLKEGQSVVTIPLSTLSKDSREEALTWIYSRDLSVFFEDFGYHRITLDNDFCFSVESSNGQVFLVSTLPSNDVETAFAGPPANIDPGPNGFAFKAVDDEGSLTRVEFSAELANATPTARTLPPSLKGRRAIIIGNSWLHKNQAVIDIKNQALYLPAQKK